jgi:hypothetical protein
MGANYVDAGVCSGKKGGAIQVVTHDTQDVRGKCRIHTLGGGVCVGAAGLRVSGGVFGKFVIY